MAAVREALALRTPATAVGARGLCQLFFTSTFVHPSTTHATPAPPKADPSPNLFVSGLSKRTTTEGLREAFSKFGEVGHAKVVTDRLSGYSKGFGFVTYSTAAGIEGMDGKEQLDPFSLVADELSLVANRLRDMVVAEVPKLASAAEYFFKLGLEGKRFRPTVLLLMATAMNVPVTMAPVDTVADKLGVDLRTRQQSIAEITEMIHVASLLHDDVLDDAETRRGVGSLNVVMGNKLSVLAGDFLLSRACVALASLKNTEVVSLLSQVVEHLVTGETMQMTTTAEQRCCMEYYMQKTYYKTASLISNSCKAIALLGGQATEVATLAYEYGKNLGLAFQLIDDVLDFTGTSASLGKGSLSDIRHGIVTAPILFAMEEYPQLRDIVQQGFDDPANVDLALEYLGKSRGLQRAKELAKKHATLAAEAIESLPETDDENVRRSRRALVDLTHIVITRTK